MDERFLRCIPHVLRHEGGYVPASAGDPGGETNLGISKRSYPGVDIKALTAAEATAIYYRDFWRPLRLDLLKEAAVAGKILDIAVNVGLAAGQTMAQRAVNLAGAAVRVDCKLGPVTRAAIDARPVMTMLLALVVTQTRHYSRLIALKPQIYARYETGWLRRAAWLPGMMEVRE